MDTWVWVVIVFIVVVLAVLAGRRPKKKPQEPLPQHRPVPHREPPEPPSSIGRLEQLRRCLVESGKPFRSTPHDNVYSAVQRAAAMGEPGKSVAKAVIFCRADGTQPVMFVVSAADRVDLGIAQTIVGSDARLATEEELGRLFSDCQPAGAHPPFGSFYGIRTILDDEFCKESSIIFLMGHHNESTSMAMRDYVDLAKPEIRRVRQMP